jgi:hypothetical protein
MRKLSPTIVIQIAFSPLDYPGIQNGWFHFNIYTGPPFLLLATNVVAIVLVLRFFKEADIDVAVPGDRKSKAA